MTPRSERLRGRRAVAVVAAAAVSIAVTSVVADARTALPRPGDRPSTARVAMPGHSYHGNLTAQTADASGYRRALWKVRLKRLTQLTVRWSQPPRGRIQLNVLPDEITDRNWRNQEPLQSSNTDALGHAAFILVAPVPGWYYLDFVSTRPGPYSFSLSRVTPARL